MQRLEPLTSEELGFVLELLNTSTVQLGNAEHALSVRARIAAHYNAQLMQEMEDYRATLNVSSHGPVEEYTSPLAGDVAAGGDAAHSAGGAGVGERLESRPRTRQLDPVPEQPVEPDPEPTPARR